MLFRFVPPKLRPPGDAVLRVRRGHPLADGLVACIVTGGQYGLGRDLITGAMFTGTNSPTIGTTPDGAAVDFSGTAYAEAPHQDSWNVLGPVTVLWRGVIRTPSVLGFLVGKVPAGGSGATNTPYGLEYNNGATAGPTWIRSNATGGDPYKLWVGPASSIIADTPQTIAVSTDATVDTTPSIYVDGVLVTTTFIYGFGGGAPTGNTDPLRIGRRPDGAEQQNGLTSLILISASQWTAGQNQIAHFSPYAVTEEAPRYYASAAPPGGTTWVGLFDPDIIAQAWFDPVIRPIGWWDRDLVDAPETGNAGTLSQTLGAATLSADGTLPIIGSADVSLGAVTPVATATLAIQGASAVTLGAVTVAAVGVLPITAAASVTLGAASIAAAGAVEIRGATAATLGAASIVSAGALLLQGSAAITLGAVAPAAAGTLAIQGDASAILGAVTAVAAGALPIVAATGVTLGAATLTADGTIGAAGAIAGDMAVTLGSVTLNAAGTLPIVAASSVALGSATTTAVGTLAIQGQASVTLGAVVSSAAGVLPIQAVASLPLGAVTVVSAAVLALQGSAAITLGAVTSSAAGAVALTGDISAVLGAVSLESGGYHGNIAASASRTVVLPARSRSAAPMARDRGIASPARDRAAVVADRARGLVLPARDRTFSPEDRT